jgi:hypothetical protein
MPWWPKKVEEKPKSKIEKRVERIGTQDLLLWADQALTSLGRDLTDWRKGGPHDLLAEAEIAAESLLILIREVRGRTER